ncbi:MAG: DUF1015 domain-containing protein, partial [Lachnospiraceae bacterium]|nr:DUF1015 domain-containing protein [Lachnospiraceae bacterium]
MTMIRPFAAIHPRKELGREIAALPYDVFTRREALDEIANHPRSFLRIDLPETNFDDSVPPDDDRVYQKAGELFAQMLESGEFVQEEEPCYFIYELTMNGHVQNGIVGCVAVDEYLNGTIKRHENTREDKEKDRIRHIDTMSAHTGPVYLAHRLNHSVADVIRHVKEEKEPLYDFTTRDDIRHRVFLVDRGRDIDNITFAYANTPCMYIADGHHRAASAVRVAQMRRESHPRWTG